MVGIKKSSRLILGYPVRVYPSTLEIGSIPKGSAWLLETGTAEVSKETVARPVSCAQAFSQCRAQVIDPEEAGSFCQHRM